MHKIIYCRLVQSTGTQMPSIQRNKGLLCRVLCDKEKYRSTAKAFTVKCHEAKTIWRPDSSAVSRINGSNESDPPSPDSAHHIEASIPEAGDAMRRKRS